VRGSDLICICIAFDGRRRSAVFIMDEFIMA
jgi:hypothetical protein